MWLGFNGKSCFANMAPIRFGIIIVSDTEIQIFMLSVRNKHIFHISINSTIKIVYDLVVFM